MNKVFKNRKVRGKFFTGLLSIFVVHVFSLFLWYALRIGPTLHNIEQTKYIIINEKIKSSYSSIESLENDLNNISKEYKVIFQILDENNNIIKSAELKNNMQLFNSFVKVNDNLYIINAYFPRNITPFKLIFSLISFQIFIIVLLIILSYLLAGHSIITPIEKIITDIRNYKFGKKPIRNEVNNELDIIQNEFVNLVDSLEEEKQEQKRIIASISHDIKTPLTSIIGYTSLMEDNLSKKELKEYSLKVHDKALHIKNILITFDDYLVNYDNKKLNLAIVNIKDIIKELNDDYKIELKNKNIDFNITTNCEDEKVNIDVLKIKRVFSNIISNSIKYVPKKGKIDISIKNKNNYIEFLVADNGSGVNEKNADKIFDPFFTTDSSRKISGLGLSICKEFIEIHNGTIEAINNNGLIIKFTLPIYRNKILKDKKK